MAQPQRKYTFSKLPLATKLLQTELQELPLDDKPSAQRRSTTFKASTPGVWARVNPLWSSWPLRITKEELMDMGVDVDEGEQISVEDVLARWDPVDRVGPEQESGEVPSSDGKHEMPTSLVNGSQSVSLELRTSKHRLSLEPVLLGISPGTLKDNLPHLDVGDLSKSSAEQYKSEAAKEMVDVLSGRKVLMNDTYGPWSTRYCGHQFGVWAGQLGDGRAISVLETEDSASGVGRQEIQLKGAGRTPFSRSADGLAVLRSGVREYLGCEAVAALGIPTTRSLALLTTTNLPVIREQGPEPPSLLARVAPSFIRIGHFEALNPGEAAHQTRQIFFGGGWQQDERNAAEDGPLGGEGNLEGLGELTRWCMGIMGEPGNVHEWVKDVVKRNAEMVGMWQVYGFCHGVLNTDNISILGLTIDYGPYAFMDVFNESHICNHSDPTGLYSYKNQPSRVLFALDKLVAAVSPLIGYEAEHGHPFPKEWSTDASKEDVARWNEKAEEVLGEWEKEFWDIEKETERKGWQKRFGLKTYDPETDERSIIYDFLTILRSNNMDLNTSFRYLTNLDISKSSDPEYLSHWISTIAEESISDKRNDAVKLAESALDGWIKVYIERASRAEEVSAWQNEEGDGKTEDVGGGDWRIRRMEGMKAVNPRFVLRQWVLEELIGELEGLDYTEEEDIQKGRGKLAKILDMSSRPFEAWGEGESADSGDARLCGLGAKEMLGFQCSCSS